MRRSKIRTFANLARAPDIVPSLAMRRTAHGSGLGRWRWVVERTFAWIGRNRRFAKDYERMASTALAFIFLAAATVLMKRVATFA